jgi:hypothetical protein
MKTRIGWVSNSSTTSFVIMGGLFRQDAVEKGLGLKSSERPTDDCDNFDEIVRVADKAGLEAIYDEYDDYVYIGLPLDSLGDDETKAQFKKRADDLISKTFNITADSSFINETVDD